jgi:hypothetical protein
MSESNVPTIDLGAFQDSSRGISQKFLGQTEQSLDSWVAQAVVYRTSNMIARNQAAVVKTAEVIGNVRLRQPGCLHDLAD